MKPEFFDENGSDFLITDPVNYNAQGSSIPDLHKTEELPTPAQVAVINKNVDSKVTAKESIEEKITKDLGLMQSKLAQVPKSPLDKLKSLIERGTLIKTISAFGYNFELRALDQADLIIAFDDADTLASRSGKAPAIKLTLVTQAIESLDGVSIYQWFPDIKLEDFKDNKLAYAQAVRRALRRYLEPMPDAVIEKLYEEYEQLVFERDQALAEVKNS